VCVCVCVCVSVNALNAAADVHGIFDADAWPTCCSFHCRTHHWTGAEGPLIGATKDTSRA